MNEVWKCVIGYEGIYQISNKGNVKSCKRLIYKNGGQYYSKEFIMKTHIDELGYIRVCLRSENKGKNWLVHRLVALAFIRVIENKKFVNHIDGNKENNNVSNLEWCTSSENRFHAFKIGLASKLGVKNSSCKLTEAQVLEIRKIHTENPKTPILKTASQFGISKQLVSRINLRQNWTHI